MLPTRTEFRAKFLAEAEQAIDELPEWTDHTPWLNLTQIENAVLKMRRQLSEQAAQAVIESQAAQRPVPGPLCPNHFDICWAIAMRTSASCFLGSELTSAATLLSSAGSVLDGPGFVNPAMQFWTSLLASGAWILSVPGTRLILFATVDVAAANPCLDCSTMKGEG